MMWYPYTALRYLLLFLPLEPGRPYVGAAMLCLATCTFAWLSHPHFHLGHDTLRGVASRDATTYVVTSPTMAITAIASRAQASQKHLPSRSNPLTGSAQT